MIILKIILAICIMISVIFFIRTFWDYLEWVSTVKKQLHYTKIKFSFLKKIYRINASRWRTCFNGHYSWFLPLIYCKTEDIYESYIYTSYIDYLKLIFFKSHKDFIKEKRKDSQNQAESLKAIIEVSQKDINKMRDQAQEEINKAVKINKEVKERLYSSFDLLGVVDTCPDYIEKEGVVYERHYLKTDAKDTQCWYKEVG